MVPSSLLEFADKISVILPVIMKEFARRQFSELYKTKITLPQFFILELLSREGESKMNKLAGFMRVTTAAMTGTVERLVKCKYVVRESDSKDRRIINIKLTAKGHDIVNKMNEYRRQMIIKIFGGISETDRQDYLRVLTKIKDILSEESKQIE